MASASPTPLDPGRDAAALLRRLGFMAAMIGLPVANFLSDTGAVLFLALGTALIAGGALLDGQHRRPATSLGALSASPAVLALALLAGWTLLSCLWTPDTRLAVDNLVGEVAVLCLAAAAYLALPDRMRSANLYLVPIGATLAVATAAAFLFREVVPGDRALARGLAALVLFAWPAIAWLRSRGRDVEAAALALVIAFVAGLAPERAGILALAAGAIAFLAVRAGGRPVALALGVAIGAVVLLAPGLPFLLGGVSASGGPGWAAEWAAWRESLAADPFRLVTGHGGASLAEGGPGGLLTTDAPGTPLLAVWYELGLVGALSLAALPLAALRGAVSGYAGLAPGVAALVTSTALLLVAGVDDGEAWFPAAIAAAGLAFVAVQRGQFRTRRPRALFVPRPRVRAS